MEYFKKYFKNIAFFVILIFLTFFFILRGQDLYAIKAIIFSSNKLYILIAILLMFCYFVFDAINTKRTLKEFGEKIGLLKCVKYSLIGFFFSAITPATSGGQAMQVYYMHKENIKVSNSSLALLINLSSLQIVTMLFAFIGVLLYSECFKDNLFLLISFIVGNVFNIIALVILLIMMFSTRILRFLVNLLEKLLRKFKRKNVEKRIARINEEIDNYKQGAKYIKNNPNVFIKNILTTLFQFAAYFSITYFVCKAIRK